jgi:hypothetical protein
MGEITFENWHRQKNIIKVDSKGIGSEVSDQIQLVQDRVSDRLM